LGGLSPSIGAEIALLDILQVSVPFVRLVLFLGRGGGHLFLLGEKGKASVFGILKVLSEEFLIENLELGAQVQDFIEEGLLQGLGKVLGSRILVESLQVASLFLGAPSLLVGGRELFCEILLEVGANKVLIYTYLLMQGG
jgi:hypothetical protein